VLLYPDMSKPTVTVNVTYLVGSRMENYGETGMAHLLEHLMFKGRRVSRIPTENSPREDSITTDRPATTGPTISRRSRPPMTT